MPTKEYRYKLGESTNTSPTRFLSDKPELSERLHDEKIETLFQEYHLGRTALDQLLAETASLTESELQLLADIAVRGFQAKNKLWVTQLLFVVYMAKKRNDLHSSLEDLIQEGALGVLKGIEKFDLSKDVKLSTYTVLWIKSAMKRFDAADRTIKIPENLMEVINLLRNEESSESVPTHQYLLEGLLALELIHLDAVEYELLEKAPFIDSEDHFSFLFDEDAEIYLQPIFEQILTVQEELVLKLYFGLGYNTPHEMHQIADILQVTKRRVFTVRKNAIDKLKKYFGITQAKDRNERVPN